VYHLRSIAKIDYKGELQERFAMKFKEYTVYIDTGSPHSQSVLVTVTVSDVYTVHGGAVVTVDVSLLAGARWASC
jgi:hypothetical protein